MRSIDKLAISPGTSRWKRCYSRSRQLHRLHGLSQDQAAGTRLRRGLGLKNTNGPGNLYHWVSISQQNLIYVKRQTNLLPRRTTEKRLDAARQHPRTAP